MKIKLIFIGLLVFAGFRGVVYAGEDRAEFPYYKHLKAVQTQTKPIGLFVLDDEIFAATDISYNNMRIFDEAGAETQFLIRPKIKGKYVIREYNIPVEQISFNLPEDNMMEIVLKQKQKKKKLIPAVIEFVTRERDFEKQVTVYGSNNHKDWKVLVRAQPIFDYSRYIDVKNQRVEIPEKQFIFYKIELWNITETRQSPFTQICRETKGPEPLREMEKVSFLKKDFKIEQIKFIEKRKIFAESEKKSRFITQKILELLIKIKKL